MFNRHIHSSVVFPVCPPCKLLKPGKLTPTKSMENAFRVFFVDLLLAFTGREPEVRTNNEPNENVDLFAIFWGVFAAKN